MASRPAAALALSLVASLATPAAWAQSPYPVSTVTLVTHSSPGGGSDVFVRTLAKYLGPKMGVSFAIENVTGGSGARAVARVAQAPADGSMLYVTTPTYIQTTLLSKPQFGYDSLMPQLEAARRALAVRAEPTVPCNNDLLAANFIDDGRRIWLIDYEYAGNNDACFELGNIWGECHLSADALADLVTAYYGRTLRNKIARARLLGMVGKYGWTLWGAIQAATSPIEFDFWSWAMERYEGAAAGLTGPDFPRLLDDVQRDD